MRGNPIKVRAKKRIDGIFEVGDTLKIQSILYDKPRLLVNALCVIVTADGEMHGMVSCPSELVDKPIGTKVVRGRNYHLVKAFDAVYAGVGTYNYSVIILSDGTEYNDSILGYKTLDYAFDKLN